MAYVDDFPTDARIVRWNLLVAFTALGIGGLFGMIQALHRTDVFRGFVSSADYYSVLTGHGVLLALFFTIFALCSLGASPRASTDRFRAHGSRLLGSGSCSSGHSRRR